MNPQDEEFLATLLELRDQDLDMFMQLVLLSLKRFPDLAVEDDQPAEQKLEALKRMLAHFESKEEYEDCAFLRDLQKTISDAEKGQVSSNEQ
jgi:hypothetical protein